MTLTIISVWLVPYSNEPTISYPMWSVPTAAIAGIPIFVRSGDCGSFADRAPVDFICGSPALKCRSGRLGTHPVIRKLHYVFSHCVWMLFLFGWSPCQRSDITLMEVSQRALDSLYISNIWLLYIGVFFVNLIWYLYLFWLNKHCLSLSLNHHNWYILVYKICTIPLSVRRIYEVHVNNDL